MFKITGWWWDSFSIEIKKSIKKRKTPHNIGKRNIFYLNWEFQKQKSDFSQWIFPTRNKIFQVLFSFYWFQSTFDFTGFANFTYYSNAKIPSLICFHLFHANLGKNKWKYIMRCLIFRRKRIFRNDLIKFIICIFTFFWFKLYFHQK